MKYSYQLPVSSYTTRYSQYTPMTYTPTHYTPSNYTPTHYTPSNYTPTHYTPTNYTPTHYTPTKYTPTSYTQTKYSSTHYTPTSYTPSLYTPTHKTSSSYTPSYSKGTRYSAAARHTAHIPAQQTPAPLPLKPVRAVHFSNDIIFQDLVRHGEMEQIGRFMRAKKVRLHTLFPSGMAALHEAVLTGNLDCVKLLVKYGADVHQRDEDGWTPLHMACSDGFPEIASYLLSLGASAFAENENGEKPADLIDPDCKELVNLFEAGCV
ncbi:protein phosphatase 1 regulatory subunit 27-like [Oncorhynchus nerka]|uniref:protein phosphatase 1 regulatory subunit 27-like n=1 Tax=Oncorhynchus nerka TaxID=8023 RepID=UPI0011315EF0|nr:protein phosphatase 1 regulatory subunit 27-like isoform X1 [Oncorhynchus nerka]